MDRICFAICWRARRCTVDLSVILGRDHQPDSAESRHPNSRSRAGRHFTSNLAQHLSDIQHEVADPSSVRVVPATSSLAALNQLASQIGSDRSKLTAQGILIDTVGASIEGNDVVVGLDQGAVPGAEAALAADYPGAPLATKRIEVERLANQYSVAPPWYAGYELNSPISGPILEYDECTEGFNTTIIGTTTTYVSTAAHCFANGNAVYHALASGDYGQAGEYVGGVVMSGNYTGSLADVEMISPLVSQTPGTVLTNNNTVRNVYTFDSYSYSGVSLCKSGLTTGETCSNSVIYPSITVCYPDDAGVCFSQQEETHNPVNPATSLPGDSGGPVYRYYSANNVSADGWISGIELTCTNNGCVPDGNMFFTPVGGVQVQFNQKPISTIG
jgi:hypothetical protein